MTHESIPTDLPVPAMRAGNRVLMILKAGIATGLLLVSCCVPGCGDSSMRGEDQVSRYNVVWDSPSKDFTGSVPLGNGDIALNAWVEESGDLLFYIAKTDSWDENGRLIKVGRLRISPDPKPATPLRAFRQILNLADGTLEVHYGEGADNLEMLLRVDAHHPVITVEMRRQTPGRAVAAIELWRTTPMAIPAVEASDVLAGRTTADGKPLSYVVDPDSIVKDLPDRIGWFHFNSRSEGPEITAPAQGLEGFRRDSPLLHRISGALVTTEKGEKSDDLHLRSDLSENVVFNVWVLTAHPSSPEAWLASVESLHTVTQRIPPEDREQKHREWWSQFWDRSWIHVTPAGNAAKPSDDDAAAVSRAYALQRYVNACAGRGRYPIKFNGSLFTVPYPGRPGDADYRQWGPGYWWQNTRLPYISMCTSGDFDLMQPLFRMYAEDLMPLFRYRTRHYLGHDGVFIPECIFFWGDIFSATYGWTPFDERKDKLQESGWHKWEWVSGPELVWMLLDYYDHTLDAAFLRDKTLPAAREVLTFFDQHYPTDSKGVLVMYPSQACETWWDCTNPMPEIAGLRAVVDRLLALPEGLTTREQREWWTRFKGKLPELPVRSQEGREMLAPAGRFENKMNIENPELYAVFPFRLIAFDKPGVDLGREAFRTRWDRGNFGWRQDDVFAAYLGLADTARDYLVGRAKNKNVDSRFPAFWGPNYDWIPDQDHGGILLKTLQAMVMQTDGMKIYLLPAWPKEWNVEFKLHAPSQTTVQGRIVNGKVEELTVTPPERREDITVLEAR